MTDGGYDDGYNACRCFWGREPSSLIVRLVEQESSVSGWHVLDAGCGEGKNAAFLAERGARVRAVDVSAAAIRNARQAWERVDGITWEIADITTLMDAVASYDLVVAYGLLHCLPDDGAIEAVVRRLQRLTRPGGYNVVCTFNSRSQDLSAHPGLRPTLMSHQAYLDKYVEWRVVHESDTDLRETHPTNNIPHTHSMTRLIAQKLQKGVEPWL